MLNQEGININATGHGTTALMFAANWGHYDIFNLLLHHHADVNVNAREHDNNEYTALSIAALGSSNDDVLAVQTLLARGADVTVKLRNETILNIAMNENSRQSLRRSRNKFDPKFNAKHPIDPTAQARIIKLLQDAEAKLTATAANSVEIPFDDEFFQWFSDGNLPVVAVATHASVTNVGLFAPTNASAPLPDDFSSMFEFGR